MTRLVKLFLFIISITLMACQTQRVVFTDGSSSTPAPLGEPVYVDHFDFYFLGLVGNNRVILQDVCMDQTIRQAQVLRDPTDLAFSVFSLGVYHPVTVRVWCGQ
jgi:hypothetical protein